MDIAQKVVDGSQGAGIQYVTVNAAGCEFDPHLRKLNIFYFHFFAQGNKKYFRIINILVSRHSAALSSAT